MNVKKEIRELNIVNVVTEVITFITVAVGTVVIMAATDDANGFSLAETSVRLFSAILLMSVTIWYRTKASRYLKFRLKEIQEYLDLTNNRTAS